MLFKVYPKGIIINDVYIRMWDGMNSFGQQLGTYPIVCGVNGIRLEIGKKYDLEVIGHNLRSVICKVAK
jgi:radical SAM superfamily enzyme with C-terminal helix-hairpin-helix motif